MVRPRVESLPDLDSSAGGRGLLGVFRVSHRLGVMDPPRVRQVGVVLESVGRGGWPTRGAGGGLPGVMLRGDSSDPCCGEDPRHRGGGDPWGGVTVVCVGGAHGGGPFLSAGRNGRVGPHAGAKTGSPHLELSLSSPSVSPPISRVMKVRCGKRGPGLRARVQVDRHTKASRTWLSGRAAVASARAAIRSLTRGATVRVTALRF